MRKAEWKPKVRVTPRHGRDQLLLRWVNREGLTKEEVTGLPIGKTEREIRVNRNKAARLAAAKEQELALEPANKDRIDLRIEDFETHQRAQGKSKRTINQQRQQLTKFFTERKIVTIDQFTSGQIDTWIDKFRRLGRSTRTCNCYLESIKVFGHFLEREGLVPRNPAAFISKQNQDIDRRRVRRVLSEAELDLLIATAECSKRKPGGKVSVPAEQRAVVYAIASWTGLRANEIATLETKNVFLAANPPLLIVEAGSSKRRRKDRIVLHPDAAKLIRAHMVSRLKIGRLFDLLSPTGVVRRLAAMLKRDLADARKLWIKAATNEGMRQERELSGFLCWEVNGEVADFHSLRHGFISRLARAGVPLATTQKMARHSDPRLTSKAYIHLEDADHAQALQKLKASDKAPRHLTG